VIACARTAQRHGDEAVGEDVVNHGAACLDC
jgi:hypothetical protein